MVHKSMDMELSCLNHMGFCLIESSVQPYPRCDRLSAHWACLDNDTAFLARLHMKTKSHKDITKSILLMEQARFFNIFAYIHLQYGRS